MPVSTFTKWSKYTIQRWLRHGALALAVSTAMTVGMNTTMMSAHAAVTTADFSDLVQQVTPAVARVNVTKTVSEAELAQAQTAELLRQFLVTAYRFLTKQRHLRLSMLMAPLFLLPLMAIC